MAVDWDEEQAQHVTAVLAKHPPRSSECELAARAILPIAHELDPSSRAIKITPAGRARFLATRVSLGGAWWFHHVTTEVTEHYVDCLTGTFGTETVDYFASHYEEGDLDAYLLQVLDLEGSS